MGQLRRFIKRRKAAKPGAKKKPGIKKAPEATPAAPATAPAAAPSEDAAAAPTKQVQVLLLLPLLTCMLALLCKCGSCPLHATDTC